MRIYIDEAGNFVVPPAGRPFSYSLVFALAIPSSIEKELLSEFIHLRDHWPNQAVEVKGSSLDESEAAELIALVSQYEVLGNYQAVDMTTHGDSVVSDFKYRQAAELTANLTAEHSQDMVTQVHKDADAMRAMPNQLFLQGLLTIDLLLDVLQEATLYYSRRLPKELGDIAWVIDPKDQEPTQMEEMWTKYILPFGESRFAKKRLISLVDADADYSYFDASYGVKDEPEMMAHLKWMNQTYQTPLPGSGKRPALDLGLLFSQRKFVDSRDSLGVQLADMLGNILRRAFNDQLEYSGWKDFGKLLVRKSLKESSILQIGLRTNAPTTLQGRAEKVWMALNAKAKM